MSYMVDTNILVRLLQRNDPMYSDTRRACLTLRRQNEQLCIIPQNLIEFWAVATRPVASNGLGLTIEQTVQASRRFKRFFTLYPDVSEILPAWESLVIKYEVKGKQVHDTRLVAAMVVHESHLLTFNMEDFNRFSEIAAIAPQFV